MCRAFVQWICKRLCVRFAIQSLSTFALILLDDPSGLYHSLESSWGGKFAVKTGTPKNRDFIVLIIVGILMIGGFIMTTFKLIDQEDKHVRDVEKVRISEAFSDDLMDNEYDSDTVHSIVNRKPNATKCDLSAVTVTDELMEKVAELKHLKELILSHSKVTDAGLKYLENMPLVKLDLSGTTVSDAGLDSIAKIPTLFRLDLSKTRVTDAGMKKLENNQELNIISVNGTAITDEGIKILQRCKGLKRLYVGQTRVTDEFLKYAATMDLNAIYCENTAITGDGIRKHLQNTNLRKLILDHCNIGDRDVPAIIAAAPKLQVLSIGSTKVTDAGLIGLAGLLSLKSVRVGNCRGITKAGLQRFSQVRPDCKIATHYF
jgi:hypothetical protein